VAQLPAARPFAELDLGDELRFGPARPPRQVVARERRRRTLTAFELVGETVDLGGVESVPTLPAYRNCSPSQ
jgi:hypothetical protein